MKPILALLFLLASCSAAPFPPPPLPPEGGATCASSCARMWSLACPGSEPTPEGATCEEVCVNVQSSGVISWDLTCRSAAASCPAIDACE